MLKEYSPYLTNLLELTAALAATYNYKKYAKSTEKHFLYFLWFTFALDVTGGILKNVFGISITWLYNIYIGLSFLFYYQWFYKILNSKYYKKISILFALGFLVIFIYNFIVLTPSEYHSNSFVTGALFVLALTSFYLYQLMNANNTIIIKRKLSFWIAIGLVLFNIGMIPFFLLSQYFKIWHPDNFTFIIILLCLNFVLYSCYIIGFIWTQKKYNHF